MEKPGTNEPKPALDHFFWHNGKNFPEREVCYEKLLFSPFKKVCILAVTVYTYGTHFIELPRSAVPEGKNRS